MTAPWPALVLAAVLGLAVGSFLNVVIYRVPRGESVVSPPSHCPGCDSLIKARHNVPVFGWLALRGRCATCAMRISPRYPLVEAATGLAFASVTWTVGLTPVLPVFLFVAATVVTLAMIDADLRRLPPRMLAVSYALTAAGLVGATLVARDVGPALPAVVGGAALTVVVAASDRLTGHRRAAVAGLVGLCLGWVSWPAVIAGTAVGVATLVVALLRRPRAATIF